LQPSETPAASKQTSQRQSPVIKTALTSVMTAIVLGSTFFFQVPIPATGGYFNLGDVMIFITALTFGPEVGGFAGGVGSALSDLLGGFGVFAPFTLVIKGAEGLTAGLISRRLFKGRDIIGWGTGSVVMVGGYFLAESFFIALLFGASDSTGIVAALGELPFNVIQVAAGVVSIPISYGLRLAFRETPLCFGYHWNSSRK
jgi:uncharacterized membrane protein